MFNNIYTYLYDFLSYGPKIVTTSPSSHKKFSLIKVALVRISLEVTTVVSLFINQFKDNFILYKKCPITFLHILKIFKLSPKNRNHVTFFSFIITK